MVFRSVECILHMAVSMSVGMSVGGWLLVMDPGDWLLLMDLGHRLLLAGFSNWHLLVWFQDIMGFTDRCLRRRGALGSRKTEMDNNGVNAFPRGLVNDCLIEAWTHFCF